MDDLHRKDLVAQRKKPVEEEEGALPGAEARENGQSFVRRRRRRKVIGDDGKVTGGEGSGDEGEALGIGGAAVAAAGLALRRENLGTRARGVDPCRSRLRRRRCW